MPTAGVPETWKEKGEHLRKLAKAINLVLRGKTNNTKSLTLDVAPATTTDLDDATITAETVPLVMPQTATAAAAMTVLRYTATRGKITFTHDANAAADRDFGVVLVG